MRVKMIYFSELMYYFTRGNCKTRSIIKKIHLKFALN